MQRPLYRQQMRIPNKLTDEDAKYMKEMAKERFDRVMEVLRNLPLPMLFIFRYVLINHYSYFLI